MPNPTDAIAFGENDCTARQYVKEEKTNTKNKRPD